MVGRKTFKGGDATSSGTGPPPPNHTCITSHTAAHGSEPQWHCTSDTQLLRLFNTSFPLPNQASWTVHRPSSAISTNLISILRMQDFTADEWRRLPVIGKNTGNIGCPTSHLWEWTLSYKRHSMNAKREHSLDSRRGSDPATTVEESKSELGWSLALSQPLVR
jgi:hypothetical protein